MAENRSIHTLAQIDEAVAIGLKATAHVASLQALRDYTGSATVVYARGDYTSGDGGGGDFLYKTGAAVGYYVDDDQDTIVPTAGDGSAAWVKKLEMGRPFASVGIPDPGNIKMIVGGSGASAGKFYVISRGGGGHGVLVEFFTGNIADPALPADSENGAWEFWRTGVVSAIEYAWVWKGPTSETGVWADAPVDAVSEVSDDAEVAIFKYIISRLSTEVGGISTLPVIVPKSGKLRIGFRCTPTSPLAQEVKIDGVVAGTFNLRSTVATVRTVEISATPGTRTVTIEHTEADTNLYVIGANFTELGELTHSALDVDKWGCYSRSPVYVATRGAADYAFMAAATNNYAGSYHGGETKRFDPEFSVDYRTITPTDGMVYLGRRLSILQQTTLNWSTGEHLDLNSLTIAGDGSMYMSVVAKNVDLVADTVFLGMATTAPSFDSAIGADFYGAATGEGLDYRMGPSQTVTQIERGTGRLTTTEFSEPPFLDSPIRGGLAVAFTGASYAKVYPGFVRNTTRKLPTTFAWSFIRKFH